MRVGFRDLTLWSFLMATAHGAGLMIVPILLGWPDGNQAGHAMSHAGHLSAETSAFAGPWRFLAAVGLHSAGYLLVATLIALLVYEKLGLELLHRAWFNLDLLWVFALMLSGVLILFV
jgi:hypothetical protein